MQKSKNCEENNIDFKDLENSSQDLEDDEKDKNENLSQDSDSNKITIDKDEYEKLLNSEKENKENLLYKVAEFENCKRRLSKETQDSIKYANEKIILDILPIIDNLLLAMDHAKDHSKTDEYKGLDKFLEGISMIVDQFYNTLSNYGVELIKSVGEDFDPEIHEALDQRSSKDHKSGKVINEYQKGYKLNDKVIRCSKVSVCKNEK